MLNPYFTLFIYVVLFLLSELGDHASEVEIRSLSLQRLIFPLYPNRLVYALLVCSAQSLNLLTWTFCKPLNKGCYPFLKKRKNLEHQYLNSCASPAVKWIARKARKVGCFISWCLSLRLCNYVKAAGCTISKFCPLWCVKVIAN